MLLSVSLLASCGTDEVGVADAGASPQQGFKMKSGEMFDDDSQKILGRYGTTNPMFSNGQGGSASEASSVNQQFTGEYSKREFQGKNYDKKSFWGRKDYAKQVYSGNLDGSRFQHGAREGSQLAREGSTTSREAGRVFATGESPTSAAREADKKGIPTNSDAETDVRRRVFQQPEVRDWRNQRALSVEDTKDMLGR
ncbi:hypothetical protein HAHE_40340 [Haloferula helveola]|uniref:Lipoprotein n=2 Tax=Haloferula helveola TaxID=490095 RepID=A0ABN6H8Y6_9BACT|nr:hypothetical protein HAHE_40340 [Haloferula helveola]